MLHQSKLLQQRLRGAPNHLSSNQLVNNQAMPSRQSNLQLWAWKNVDSPHLQPLPNTMNQTVQRRSDEQTASRIDSNNNQVTHLDQTSMRKSKWTDVFRTIDITTGLHPLHRFSHLSVLMHYIDSPRSNRSSLQSLDRLPLHKVPMTINNNTCNKKKSKTNSWKKFICTDFRPKKNFTFNPDAAVFVPRSAAPKTTPTPSATPVVPMQSVIPAQSAVMTNVSHYSNQPVMPMNFIGVSHWWFWGLLDWIFRYHKRLY